MGLLLPLQTALPVEVPLRMAAGMGAWLGMAEEEGKTLLLGLSEGGVKGALLVLRIFLNADLGAAELGASVGVIEKAAKVEVGVAVLEAVLRQVEAGLHVAAGGGSSVVSIFIMLAGVKEMAPLPRPKGPAKARYPVEGMAPLLALMLEERLGVVGMARHTALQKGPAHVLDAGGELEGARGSGGMRVALGLALAEREALENAVGDVLALGKRGGAAGLAKTAGDGVSGGKALAVPVAVGMPQAVEVGVAVSAQVECAGAGQAAAVAAVGDGVGMAVRAAMEKGQGVNGSEAGDACRRVPVALAVVDAVVSVVVGVRYRLQTGKGVAGSNVKCVPVLLGVGMPAAVERPAGASLEAGMALKGKVKEGEAQGAREGRGVAMGQG